MPDESSYTRTTLAVWEITLRCNLSCSHCGSRAGKLTAERAHDREALDLVDQLAEIGIKEVALIGGSVFTHPTGSISPPPSLAPGWSAR